MSRVRAADGGCLLNVHVVPRASRSAIAGWQGDALRVRIQAPPAEGKANATLVRFMADTLGVRCQDVVLERGTRHLCKQLRVRGMDAASAEQRLNKAGQENAHA